MKELIPPRTMAMTRNVGAGGAHREPSPARIPKCMIHDALNDPPIKLVGSTGFLEPTNEQWAEHTYPAPGCSRSIWYGQILPVGSPAGTTVERVMTSHAPSP